MPRLSLSHLPRRRARAKRIGRRRSRLRSFASARFACAIRSSAMAVARNKRMTNTTTGSVSTGKEYRIPATRATSLAKASRARPVKSSPTRRLLARSSEDKMGHAGFKVPIYDRQSSQIEGRVRAHHQREAQMLPSRILKSPTRPTSIRTPCGAIAPVPAGCPQLETGAAVSDPN